MVAQDAQQRFVEQVVGVDAAESRKAKKKISTAVYFSPQLEWEQQGLRMAAQESSSSIEGRRSNKERREAGGRRIIPRVAMANWK